MTILDAIGTTPLVPLRSLARGLPSSVLVKCETARRLMVEEGLLVGGSAGTNVAAELRVAAREDVEGPVVTVLPDSWDRYFTTDWMRAWT